MLKTVRQQFLVDRLSPVHSSKPQQRSTLSKQHSTLLPKTAIMSKEFIAKISSFRQSLNKLNMFNLFRLCQKDEISFDIVAKTGNIVAKNDNNVEITFVFVKRTVRLVAVDNVASTLLLTCWCGRDFRHVLAPNRYVTAALDDVRQEMHFHFLFETVQWRTVVTQTGPHRKQNSAVWLTTTLGSWVHSLGVTAKCYGHWTGRPNHSQIDLQQNVDVLFHASQVLQTVMSPLSRGNYINGSTVYGQLKTSGETVKGYSFQCWRLRCIQKRRSWCE